MREVRPLARSLLRFRPIVGESVLQSDLHLAESVSDLFRGRTIWTINSTAVGGGVAEMLDPLVGYGIGAGVDLRWWVMQGTPEFFRITKRLHHGLHNSKGDGLDFERSERDVYESVSESEFAQLKSHIGPDDIALLHDPQTVGLAPHFHAMGIPVIWRCHIGSNTRGEREQGAWEFLRPYLESATELVFTRPQYVPEPLRHRDITIIPPSIDPFSPKNQDMDERSVEGILAAAGLLAPEEAPPGRFLRSDGEVATVFRRAKRHADVPMPTWHDRVVTQVSRWDPLKDPIGVLQGFASVLPEGQTDLHLVLAGPDVTSVADDPEAKQTYEDATEAWREVPRHAQERIHLVQLPMEDSQENAAIVNAIQRHATVVVQKSLQEGFGLTVAEAMFKARPVIASAVGGIVDQVEHGENGWLIENPGDLDEFRAVLSEVLDSPEEAASRGERAREAVTSQFLTLQSLRAYARLFTKVGNGTID